MRKGIFIFTLVFSFLCFCVFAQGGNPEQKEFQDFEELSLEDLLEIEVVTAAKKVQKISEAPAATYVITDEDIKQSGATSIPDILRMVPGIDVMEISATDFVVNARGFNQEMSNKMLVLINGRTVYWDFYGFVVWDTFPIIFEEIKRIEIVKGPGSALYGANAFSGVINILTKTPEEFKHGTSVSTTYGNSDNSLTSLIHSGTKNNLGYKVSLGWNRTSQWGDPERKEGEVKKLNATLGYRVNQTSRIAFSGGYNEGEGLVMGPHGRMSTQFDWSYLMLDYTRSVFYLRLFWNGINGDGLHQATREDLFFDMTSYDAESQYLFSIGSLNSLILGGSFRSNLGKSNALGGEADQRLYAVYAQDEFKPMENLFITLGIRYDGNSLLKNRITPRGNIFLSPIKNHFLRFSYGTAFRNPSFIEFYHWKDLDLTPQISLELPSNSVILEARGNPHLSPEKITSYQVGYETLLNERIKCKLDLFYDQLKDFISFEITSYQDISYLLRLPTGSVIVPAEQTFINEGKASAKGFEFGLDVLATNWLRGWANYSYQDITYEADDPTTPENEKGMRIKASPEHKANVGLRFEPTPGLTANLMMHHVSQTEKEKQTAFGKVDPYTVFNIRVGYKVLNEQIETSASVFNIFDNKHFEYPGYDKDGNPCAGHQIGRRVSFGILLNF